MSEKLYEFLLKLYPDHFRRTYGDEALRLVRDRARSEKGFLSGLRLWLDLLVDLAISLPREYSNAPTTPIVAAQPLNGERSFQLLAERSLNPALLCLGGTLSAVLFWAMRLCSCTQRGIPGIISGSAFAARLVQSTLARAIWRPATHPGLRRRVQLLHDRATGHSEQLSAATLCVSLCASRRVRGCTNRWKSREDIQERTASLDSCACVRWGSPVRLASG